MNRIINRLKESKKFDQSKPSLSIGHQLEWDATIIIRALLAPYPFLHFILHSMQASGTDASLNLINIQVKSTDRKYGDKFLFNILHGHFYNITYHASEGLAFIFVVRSSPNHIYYFPAEATVDAKIVSTNEFTASGAIYLYDPDDATKYEINPYRKYIIPKV